MELIVVLLVVGMIALWVRTGGLRGRLARAESDVVDLQARLAYVAARLDGLASGAPVAPAQPA